MRIRWTQPAVLNFTHICDYTEEPHGTATARNLALQIQQAITRLAEFPRMGRLGHKTGTREIVITGTPFLAVYRIREDVIQILRILHGAQQWP
jgi:toxin ParE1/3/4